MIWPVNILTCTDDSDHRASPSYFKRHLPPWAYLVVSPLGLQQILGVLKLEV